MSAVGRVVRWVAWPFLHTLRLLVGLWPRDRRLWIFGAFHGQRFADNPKWAFLLLLERKEPGFRAVWITQNPTIVELGRRHGLPIHHARSLKGLWYQLRGGVYVFEQNVWDVGWWLSRGAVLVNLWHGIPFKRINWRLNDPKHPVYKAHRGRWWQRLATAWTHPWARRKPDYMIGTSPHTVSLMSEAFEIPEDQVLETGYPRNDILLRPKPDQWPGLYPTEREALARYKDAGRRLICYLPTFRDSRLGKALPLPVDWARLDDLMAKHDAVLVVKLHPVDDASIPAGASFGNIHVLPKYADPYPVLPLCDVLITDYSSAFFDFLLLDRPLLFYPFDLDRYQTQDRPFFDPYEQVVPGPVSTEFDGLVQQLDSTLKDTDKANNAWAPERHRVRERYHSHMDGDSTERLLKSLLDRLA